MYYTLYREVSALTIDDLFALSPPLRVIIARAREARGKPYRNRLDAYTRAKDAATGLVGYGSPVDELQSGEAWEAFIRLLTDVLDV